MWLYFIVIPIVVVVAFFILKSRKDAEEEANKKIESFEAEPIQISPSMKQTLGKFSVGKTSELRQMNPDDLQDFLSFSANVLNIFEERIEQISVLYQEVEEMQEVVKPTGVSKLMGGVNFNKNYVNPNDRLKVLKERIEKQYDQVIIAFDEISMESILSIIPEKYRMSIILNKFCSYLLDGEVDTWEGCIKTFKEDIFRMQQQENFQAVINSLEIIERNTANIAKNTRMTAFFAGISAWNTR